VAIRFGAEVHHHLSRLPVRGREVEEAIGVEIGARERHRVGAGGKGPRRPGAAAGIGKNGGQGAEAAVEDGDVEAVVAVEVEDREGAWLVADVEGRALGEAAAAVAEEEDAAAVAAAEVGGGEIGVAVAVQVGGLEAVDGDAGPEARAGEERPGRAQLDVADVRGGTEARRHHR
jgi:hypothetical protein